MTDQIEVITLITLLMIYLVNAFQLHNNNIKTRTSQHLIKWIDTPLRGVALATRHANACRVFFFPRLASLGSGELPSIVGTISLLEFALSSPH